MQYLKAAIFHVVCCHCCLRAPFSEPFPGPHPTSCGYFHRLHKYLTVELIFVAINGCIMNTSLVLWTPLLHE